MGYTFEDDHISRCRDRCFWEMVASVYQYGLLVERTAVARKPITTAEDFCQPASLRVPPGMVGRNTATSMKKSQKMNNTRYRRCYTFWKEQTSKGNHRKLEPDVVPRRLPNLKDRFVTGPHAAGLPTAISSSVFTEAWGQPSVSCFVAHAWSGGFGGSTQLDPVTEKISCL